MKFTLAAATLASAAVVAADQVQLNVQQNGQSIGYLTSLHEGAGFNYFFVGPSGETYNFDPSTNILSAPQGQFTGNFGVFAPFLAIGPAVTPEALKLDKDKITNYNFWACSNVQDPYNYSQSTPVIVVNGRGNDTAPFASCKKVELVKTGGSSSGSSSSSSTVTSSQWSNVTITSYTTYCPETTVITITSCKDNACHPTAVTVSTATTITCTACVVPPATSTKTTVAPTSVTSSAAPSPTITTASNAGAKNAIGAIGVVGVAALLL